MLSKTTLPVITTIKKVFVPPTVCGGAGRDTIMFALYMQEFET
jgi:hypothetical protein